MVRKASIDAIDAMFLLKLDSSMGRQCLVCDAQIKLCVPAVKEGEGSFPTKAVTVATVHLESLGFVSKRIAQLNRIFEVLDDPSRSTVRFGSISPSVCFTKRSKVVTFRPAQRNG